MTQLFIIGKEDISIMTILWYLKRSNLCCIVCIFLLK